MYANTRFSRYAKRATDHAVSSAYSCLAVEERAPFTELLDAIRKRSTVHVCPGVVAALRNVARFSSSYGRPLAEWAGARGTQYPVIHSLVQHLLARHAVPRFLASTWYGDTSAQADVKRRWFIAHGAGERFRDLDLPMSMTRRMESLFLLSPDHLSVEAAMRRAELLALGAKDELLDAVLATRLGADLENGPFWRTVMEFFVRIADELDPGAVGPIVDFLQFVRHERIEVHSERGVRLIDPPEPGFSMKGRTLSSVQRLVEEWHRRLGSQSLGGLSWTRSRFRPLTFEEQPSEPDRPAVRWQIVELVSSAELRAEGQSLRHCVASYARRCLWGSSQIWSVRRCAGSSKVRSVATIEVDPQKDAIVQARGVRNGVISTRARDLLLRWAHRENLELRV